MSNTMRDLEIEVRRLARRAAVLNVGLAQGLPLALIESITEPVEDAAHNVIALVRVAREAGLGDLTVQITDPVPPGIAALLVDGDVPDDLSSLLGGDDAD